MEQIECLRRRIDNGKTRAVFSKEMAKSSPQRQPNSMLTYMKWVRKLRAHWLGLLGFGAVIIVIFSWFFLGMDSQGTTRKVSSIEAQNLTSSKR